MLIRPIIAALAFMLVGGYEVEAAVKPQTVMVYMNGSDLESEIGAGTEDLIEMLESGLLSENANVVVFTGGALRWQNDLVPAYECVMWYIEDGEIFEIERLGMLNMGEPDTLADFVSYAMEHFPAEKYGLVMWDHGGGAIAGFGHDEHFYDYDGGSLSLPEMDYAFEKAGLAGQKLEWLGFDSCLMATVEMAIIASKYARYLIASEDLEPGDGWDYVFLNLFNRHPRAGGYILGREIVDTFMDFYGPDSDEILTLSVVNLNRVQPVMDAMGLLMERCSDKLLVDYADSFARLAKRRGLTKTFGEGSPRDNESDMVDVGDMAHHLSDLFPGEAAAIHRALNHAVMYERNNSQTPLYGLSAYYVYGGLFYESLEMYKKLRVDEAYAKYQQKFFGKLSGRELPPKAEVLESARTLWRPVRGRTGYFQMLGINYEDESLWPHINGRPVNMYRTAKSTSQRQYAIPARVNGKDCDIVVSLHDNNGDGKIKGYRHESGQVKQKGYDIFEPGDKVAFYYPIRNFNTNESIKWLCGAETIISGPLKLEWKEAPIGSYQSRQETNIYKQQTYKTLKTTKQAS